MFWRCEHCGAINDVLTLKGPEVESLLHERSYTAVCERCGKKSLQPERMDAPPTGLLDLVETALRGQPSASHLISDDNTVAVHDTPRVWGKAFDKVGSSVSVTKAPGVLVEAMGKILGRGRSVIDIVSLDAPGEGDEFETMLFRGLSAATVDTKGAVVIRILLGFVPVEGRFNTWCGRLLAAIRSWGGAATPQLFIGQLYSAAKAQWNHCKIMASDGVRAIVGGHNLWWSAYAQVPMAHDILSDHVQRVPTLDGKKQPVRIFSCFPCEEDKQRPIASTTVFAPKIATSVMAQPVSLGHRSLLLLEAPEPYTARIMSVGRCGQSHLVSTASDITKQTIIKNARVSLKLCQQDLVFLGSGPLFPFNEEDHVVCKWIAEALLGNDRLTVKIVVSPQRAYGGGAQYSWTSGATGTMALLQKFLKKMTSTLHRYQGALARLKVAPFCFTRCEFKSEDDYRWPTLGQVGKPYPTGFACFPTPANHAKFYVADDEVCYVGSDNLYPNSNAEFGYLVEGRAVEALVEDYWNEVWKYSGPHCVPPKED